MIWGKPGSTVELCKGDDILLTIKTIKLSDAGTYTLGLQRTGTDTMGVFSIKVLPKPQRSQTNLSQTHSSSTPGPSLPPTTTVSNPIQVINVRDYSAIDQLGTETGFDGRDNLWLSYTEWTCLEYASC